MIASYMNDWLVGVKSAIYVGDRMEDYEAVMLNDLPCILVDLDYGEIQFESKDGHYSVSNSIELFSTLLGILWQHSF